MVRLIWRFCVIESQKRATLFSHYQFVFVLTQEYHGENILQFLRIFCSIKIPLITFCDVNITVFTSNYVNRTSGSEFIFSIVKEKCLTVNTDRSPKIKIESTVVTKLKTF